MLRRGARGCMDRTTTITTTVTAAAVAFVVAVVATALTDSITTVVVVVAVVIIFVGCFSVLSTTTFADADANAPHGGSIVKYAGTSSTRPISESEQ